MHEAAGDDVAVRAVRRLPPEALAGLREAFAGEVAERLPRLLDAASGRDPEALTEAVRDAHALGSSAVVVGEHDASRTARAAEALLVQWQASPEPRLVDEFVEHVERLAVALEDWR